MKVCKQHTEQNRDCLACEIDALRKEIDILTVRLLAIEGMGHVWRKWEKWDIPEVTCKNGF